jgi:hypothetical protein
MTARITSGQIEQVKKLVDDALTALKPSKEGMQRLLGNSAFLVQFKCFVLAAAGEFFVLFSDDEAVAWIRKWAGKTEEEARQIVQGFRTKARTHGVADTVHIHAKARPGATFKQDLPLMGPCWERFHYLQYWDFPDPPTEHCLLSWVPKPLQGGTNKDHVKQYALIAAFKAEAGLPGRYHVSFGSVGHVGGLVLAHFNAYHEDPFGGRLVRTDTCKTGGFRLQLSWFTDSLNCGQWYSDSNREPDLDVFAVGVIKALRD